MKTLTRESFIYGDEYMGQHGTIRVSSASLNNNM